MKDYSNISRYGLGVVTINHRGKNITTSVGTNMDNIIQNLETSYNYDIGKIPIMHKHRPDLISDTFYDTPKYWWLMMQFNNVKDPFEGFNAGDPILIPRL